MNSQQFWKFIYELLVSGKYELNSIDTRNDRVILTDKTHYYYFDNSEHQIINDELLHIHLNLNQQSTYSEGYYYFINNNIPTNDILEDNQYKIHIIQGSLLMIAELFNITHKKLQINNKTNYIKKITQPEIYDKINIMRYPATYFVTIAIVLVFIVQCLITLTAHVDWIILLGATNYIAIANHDEYYRIITSIFIHDDILHLLFNAFALMSMGRFIEQLISKIQWLILFFTSGIIANIISAYQSPEYLFIGASGAICGFIGATLYISLVDKHFKHTKLSRDMLATMLGITIFGYALGNVSHVAHFVGFISGFIIMTMLRILNSKQ